jgi:hypothetical protein
LRDEAWRTIEPITADSDPTPERTQSREAANQDWEELGIKIRRPDLMTTAINSVRGEALECVLRYALWVEAALPPERTVNAGFNAMPEVRTVLEPSLGEIKRDSCNLR